LFSSPIYLESEKTFNSGEFVERYQIDALINKLVTKIRTKKYAKLLTVRAETVELLFIGKRQPKLAEPEMVFKCPTCGGENLPFRSPHLILAQT